MRWIFLVMTGVAALSFAQQPVKLSLEDAVELGRRNSRVLQASAARAGGAAARAGEVRSALFPSLKLQGGYRRLSDVDPFAVQLPFLPAPVLISPTILNNYTMALSVQQPLFTGFRLLHASRAAALQAEASGDDHRADRADLVLTVKSAYWALFQALELRRFVDENVARLETDVRDTERMMNAGLATRNDLLRMQVQHSNARLAQIDAANDVELAMMALNNAIGQPVETQLELVSVPRDTLPGADTAARSAAQAIAQRPDFLAMEARVQAAAAGVAAARGAWWPQIFLTGGYAYNRPNARYLPARDEFKGTWDIGVQVQLDLWNWGATGFQVDQAQAALRQAELQRDQMKDNIALDVRRQSLALDRAHGKIDVARAAVEQAAENLRVTNDKYRSGLATSSDLLDAEVALLQTRTSLTGAFVECEMARARMERSLGAGQ